MFFHLIVHTIFLVTFNENDHMTVQVIVVIFHFISHVIAYVIVHVIDHVIGCVIFPVISYAIVHDRS